MARRCDRQVARYDGEPEWVAVGRASVGRTEKVRI
jgi:hypothetical protein